MDMLKKQRVVITGLGSISPLGNNTDMLWDGFLKGKSGIGPTKTFDVAAFDSRIAGEVKDFDSTKYFSSKELRRIDKFVRYAVVASIEAANDAALDIKKLDIMKAK